MSAGKNHGDGSGIVSGGAGVAGGVTDDPRETCAGPAVLGALAAASRCATWYWLIMSRTRFFAAVTSSCVADEPLLTRESLSLSTHARWVAPMTVGSLPDSASMAGPTEPTAAVPAASSAATAPPWLVMVPPVF